VAGPVALLLAAGRGERLRPLTATLPKPLLPVAGRPLAAWSLERLRAAGVEAAAINLHHLGAQIRAAFGADFGGLPLVYSEEPELLGTGGALVPLAGFLSAARAVLLVNGDTLCRWPLDRLLAAHRRAGAAATLLVHRTAEPRGFGGGVAVERGEIVAFRPGALAWRAARVKRVFAGAAVLEPRLLARLPPGPSDIVAALYEPMLDSGERIAACETARPWFDLGTPERYLEGALAWALERQPRRGARCLGESAIGAGARLARVVVEGDARVGAGARLTETLLLQGAEVGAGARLERVLLGPGARVGEGERLVECMRVAGTAPDRSLRG
jgi:mannose-1-phosphate guanylyltransferase